MTSHAVAPRGAWLAAQLLPITALALAALALRRVGFVGISDDDAARTLLAWSFARTPALDPTRSSWLPFHTYELGALLAATRESWTTPRLLSWASAAAAAALGVALARRLGAAPRWAALAVLAAAAFPWSVFSAWAVGVPEMPCTALVLTAAAIAAGAAPRAPGPARAAVAGLALSAACGHRYEAWFATAGFVAAAAVAWRPGRAWAALVAGASVVPLAWLAMNHARSGHALDFVARVVRYRGTHEALPSLGDRLLRYPALLVAHAGVLIALAAAGTRARHRLTLPLLGAACGVVLGLVVTDVRGGGATHHVARSLLLCVWCAAPLAAAALGDLARRRSNLVAAAAAVLAIAQCAYGLREVPTDVDVDTVAAGRALAGALRPGERYFIELDRLDGLWIELASGAPERAVGDRTLDPPDVPSAPRVARARGCAFALVSTGPALRAFIDAGFRAEARHGAWTRLRRVRRE